MSSLLIKEAVESHDHLSNSYSIDKEVVEIYDWTRTVTVRCSLLIKEAVESHDHLSNL